MQLLFQTLTNVFPTLAPSSASTRLDLTAAYALLVISSKTTSVKVSGEDIIINRSQFMMTNETIALFEDIIDVDECLEQPCGSSAKCTNSQGSFTCECEPGFILRGVDCEGMFI